MIEDLGFWQAILCCSAMMFMSWFVCFVMPHFLLALFLSRANKEFESLWEDFKKANKREDAL